MAATAVLELVSSFGGRVLACVFARMQKGPKATIGFLLSCFLHWVNDKYQTASVRRSILCSWCGSLADRAVSICTVARRAGDPIPTHLCHGVDGDDGGVGIGALVPSSKQLAIVFQAVFEIIVAPTIPAQDKLYQQTAG